MGDPLGAAGSIVGIAAFGLKFATTLQTYIEAVADARESLRDIAFDVSATASALDQLHQFIEAGENGKAIANDSGVQEVVRLASKCKQVYTAVINLIAKAVNAPRDDNGEILIDALDAIDLNESNVKRLVQKLKWPFQEPRIKKHQEELRWLKISLLFHLRLMELAKTKIMAPTRSFGAREREMALQANLEKLLISKQSYARRIAFERRRYKNKVRGKEVPVKRRSSSSSREIIESRSPSPKAKRPHSPSSLNDNTRELSRLSISGDGNFGIQNTLPSREPIDNELEYLPSNKIPKPPKSKSKPHTLDHIMFNQLPTEPMLDKPRVVGNNKVPENDTDPLSPTRPTPKSRQYFVGGILEPTRTQNNTHIPTTATNNSQPRAQKAPPATNNKDKEETNAHDNTIERFSNRHNPKPSRMSLNFLLRSPNFFRKRDRNKSVCDYESEDLEAYLIEEDNSDLQSNPIRKLPFSQQQLRSMLKRIMKSRGGDVWTRYTSLTSAQREGVDRALLEAHQASSHVRTCVAISAGKPESSHLVVFFSLGVPTQPVHFKYNSRYFQFAFELCRTWESMASLIKSSLNDIPDPDLFLQSGQFDLKDADDRIILPSTWSSAVQPGLTVSLIPKGNWNMRGPYPVPVQGGISWQSMSGAMPGHRDEDTGHLESNAPRLRRQASDRQILGAMIYHRGSDDDDVADVIRHRDHEPPSVASEASDVDSNIAAASAPITSVRDWYFSSRAASPRSRRADETEKRTESVPQSVPIEVVRHNEVIHRFDYIPGEREDADSDEDEDEDQDEDEEESDIIDFEEEEETARLGLDGLLGKWTNAPPDGEQQEQRGE